MALPLVMIDSLRAYGVPDEDIEFLNDGWDRPAPPLPSEQEMETRSRKAINQHNYRARQKLRLVTNGNETVTETVTNGNGSTKKGLPHTPSKETTKTLPKKEGQKEAASPQATSVAPMFPVEADLDAALLAFDEVAARRGLPRVRKLTEVRKRKLMRRLRDAGSLNAWRDVVSKLDACRFLHGDNDRGWRADFDFLLQEKSFTRLLEGGYDRAVRQESDRDTIMLRNIERNAEARRRRTGE